MISRNLKELLAANENLEGEIELFRQKLEFKNILLADVAQLEYEFTTVKKQHMKARKAVILKAQSLLHECLEITNKVNPLNQIDNESRHDNITKTELLNDRLILNPHSRQSNQNNSTAITPNTTRDSTSRNQSITNCLFDTDIVWNSQYNVGAPNISKRKMMMLLKSRNAHI